MLNSVLVAAGERIMRSTTPTQFMVKAQFINNDEGSTFSLYPFMIDEMTTNCDFVESYGDEIDMVMTISPKDWALLQDQGQNLLCVLSFTYVNRDGRMVFNPAPIQKRYYVQLTNPLDVRKAIPDIHKYTEPASKVDVRLIPFENYSLRRQRINTIFQNCTVTQAIYAITKKLGIERLELVPPDNIHNHDHIDITTFQGIESIYQYLQYKFGIYEKGSTSYVRDGVLYIYPPFDTAPKYDRTMNLYQVDSGRYAGASVYHLLEDNVISIVVNSQPESFDLSVTGAENVGSGFIFNRASRSNDGFTDLSSTEGAQYTENSGVSFNLESNRSMVKGSNNIRHIRTTDNPYPAMSEIMAYQASIMSVNWPFADPFRLDPGHAVNYYYDENGTMVKKTGILSKATFVFRKTQQNGAADIFGVDANLELRLSRNVTMAR